MKIRIVILADTDDTHRTLQVVDAKGKHHALHADERGSEVFDVSKGATIKISPGDAKKKEGGGTDGQQ